MTGLYVLVFVLVFFFFVVIPLSVKIVREYERLVVFRLGRSIGARGPGLIFLIPIIDRFVRADLREFFLEIPRQDSITKDNAPVAIDFIIYYKVFDPVASIVQVGDFSGAAQNIAATTLRAVVGDIPLDDVLAKRDEINHLLRAKLDEVTERWGVKVTSVEIREITPPAGVQEAMTRQMSAERTRRAVVTEAEGARSAAITVAEGEKQASILRAEGEKESNILVADGERQAAALRAEGFAVALRTISEAARTIDGRTMTLQYLDALTALGQSPATKIVLPLELTNLIGGIAVAAGRTFRDTGEPTSAEGGSTS